MKQCIIPNGYQSALNLHETQIGIKTVKDFFQNLLAERLNLLRVSAPLFVDPASGLNDNLNGVERPVSFGIKEQNDAPAEIVQSLAKWKRYALQKYGFQMGEGLYTDMSAIRRDEETDNIHSIYVDQWDWEKIIAPEERSLDTLTEAVNRIMEALTESEAALCLRFPQMKPFLSREVFVVSAQELADRWPELSPKEREDAICREKKTVFLTGIGGNLREGKPHDMRAPDYDDWDKNGDLLIWYPVLDRAVEVSSMGIRVDADTMRTQLRVAHCEERVVLPFHQSLLNGELPQTMGGGIGQSRICMLLLQKAHIGEVQSSVWPDGMRAAFLRAGVPLL